MSRFLLLTLQLKVILPYMTKLKVKSLALMAFVATLCGCSQLEYLPYAADVDGPHDINTREINRLHSSGLSLPIKIAVIGDSQGYWDDLDDCMRVLQQRGDIDIILHAGDVTDFGLAKEFKWTRDIMEKYGIPYLTVIGNHDCVGNGEDVFNYIFGPENFSLNVARTHIVALNTVALEYDYSRPVPDFTFIENDIRAVNALNEANPGSIIHTIVLMHSCPFDEQFNNNVANVFNYYLENYPGMQADATRTDADGNEKPWASQSFCVNGHNHRVNIVDKFDNGILYYQCADIHKRNYLLFTITETGYLYETIDF